MADLSAEVIDIQIRTITADIADKPLRLIRGESDTVAEPSEVAAHLGAVTIGEQIVEAPEVKAWIEKARDQENAKEDRDDAFAKLVERTYADTYTLAYRLMGHEEDARDVVQEAYLRAFRGLKKFRADAQFSTWLYRITANVASTQQGKRNRRRVEKQGYFDNDSFQPIDDNPDHDPVARTSAALLRERLEVAIAGLSPTLRSVVVLRDVYDLTHEVIAAELGISVPAAKVRLHRARKVLREHVFPRHTESLDID